MKHRRLVVCLICIAVWRAPAASRAAILDFESVSPGTVYGGSAPIPDNPGDLVLTQDGIRMSVEEFFLGTFVGFFKAEVGGAYDDFFPTSALELDNISVQMDFSDLPFGVTYVTLDYREFGGGDNFAVNGSPLVQLDAMTGIPSQPGALAEGVSVIVAEQNSITLEAAAGYTIDRFLIGGQELAVDNIVALPEPATVIPFVLGSLLILRRRSRRPTGRARGPCRSGSS